MARCPKCQNPLPQNGPGGLCPHCLLREGAALAASALVRPGSFLPPEAEEIALIFPEFEIESLIGRGGMGMVYQAREIESGHAVAIKLLPPEIAADREFLERFYTEAATLDELSHPNIVRLLGFGDREDYAYLVMELVEGMDLARRLRQQPSLTVEEIENIFSQLCEALGYSHAKGVIHRDIKPGNVLIAKDGTVKLADFGLAKLCLPGSSVIDLTMTRTIMGTTHYMAPEISTGTGKGDHRADVYAAGVILYEMLTGQIPAGRFELPSEKVPGLNPCIDSVVARALSAEPEQRYQSASTLSEAFSKALLARPVSWKARLILSVAVMAFGAGVFIWRPWESAPVPMPLSGTVIVEHLSGGNTSKDIRLTLSEESSPGVRVDTAGSDRGDFGVFFSAEDPTNTGTLITTIAETSRSLDWGWPHATSSFQVAGHLESRHFIAVSRLAGNKEYNMNAAFGWFAYDQFVAGEALRVGKARPLATVRGSKGLELGKQIIPLEKIGITRIDLQTLGASSKDGILLANVAENIDSFAMVEPRDDGTFTIFTVDNDAPPGLVTSGGFSFVHIPVSAVGRGKVVALGRVLSDATTSVSGGGFTLRKGGTGQWLLNFPQSGTLLLTPLSTKSGNSANNMISYRWDTRHGAYVVESRDLRTAGLEDGATTDEPMFNFVFLTP